METEAENNGSSQQPDLDKVLEKINEIAKESADGDYIYRGEPAHYQEHPYNGRVTSGLYREYLDIEADHFDVAVVQADILRAAHEYTLHKMEDFELLATLQHFGDKTNLIDFTTDYLVALFFACDGEPEKPGRVILLRRQSGSGSETYEVEKPSRTIRRAEAQERIFVQASKGFVEPDRIVTIPAPLKAALLDYLRNHHDISTKTIYNDLQGFIEKRRLHKNTYTEFYKGITSQDRADSAKTEAERQKCYTDAITHYTEAIDLNPELTEAYSNRGNAYTLKMDFDAAIEDFNKAIDLDPENALFYNNRGLAYFWTGDFDAAIEDYRKAIDLAPELTEAYSNRGLAYRSAGDFDAAIEDYSKAIDLNPEDALFYSLRGAVYDNMGDFDAAIEDYSKAIDLAPEDALFYSVRGAAYRNTGDFEAAIEDYSRVIDLAPEDALFYSIRGAVYDDMDDFDAAIEDYSKAIDLNLEDARVYNNRGLAYFWTGDFDAAIEDYSKAIDLAPEDALFYNNRGSAYGNIGDFAAAIEDFNKVIDLDPELTGVYSNRGVAWLHLKEWQKAKADLTTAKKMRVDIIESFHNDYESVEDFEAKNGVTLPKDIAALLSGNKVNDTR